VRVALRTMVALAAAGIGCNLVFGIEEHGLRPNDAGPEAEAPIPDAAPASDKCSADSDCRPPNGCYKARCDTTLGVCRYLLCEGANACSAGTCNPATFTCEDERDHGFRAASYPLGTTLGSCNKNPSACVGAAYPFLFVGTRDEVVALRIDDLRTTESRRVSIAGLRARPGRIVVSGRRVWIIGDVQGTEPPYTVALASIDVPADPTTRELEAKSAVFKYPFPSLVAFPAPSGGLYVAYDEPTNPQDLPTARFDAPVTADGIFGVVGEPPDGGAKIPPPPGTPTVSMHRIAALTPGSRLAASSGNRLVAYRFPITFNLVTEPGTDKATAQADTVLAPPYPGLVVPRFAQGPDGTVLMFGPITSDPPGDCNCSSRQRMHWVLPNAIQPSVEQSKMVDPEVYSNPWVDPVNTACHTCTGGYFAQPSLAVWVDPRSALVAAPASDPAANRVLTAVRLVERDPLAAPGKRRLVTTAADVPAGNSAVDRIALASSGGFGFLLIADNEGNSARLSVFDPRCDTN
jgi:hypothetical protein